MKKHLQIALLCALFLSAAYMLVSAAGVAAAEDAALQRFYSWGLSFQSGPGSLPLPTLNEDILAKNNAIYLYGQTEKAISLTFDAGYENGYTEKILDTLKTKNVQAVFFITGHFLSENKGIVQRMLSEGHIVGNHTQKHPDMQKKGDYESFAAELTALEDNFLAAMGVPIGKFYRPPGGSFNREQLGYAQRLGYKTLFWSLAYKDWEQDNQPSRSAAQKKLYSRMHPGCILLLHSTSSTNAEILGELIDTWRAEGYVFKLPQ